MRAGERWQITKVKGTRIELRCVKGYDRADGSPSNDRCTLAADDAGTAAAWATRIWEHIAYIEILLNWPMPMEGRQGHVRSYAIQV